MTRRLSSAALLLLSAACVATPGHAPLVAPPRAPVLATATPGPPPAPPPAPKPLVTPGMQWLYGSGEGAAASLQTYQALRDHALAAVRRRPTHGVVLAQGSPLAEPRFEPCGGKPLAVVLDVDETAIQNLGYEYALARSGQAEDRELLRRWQKGARSEVSPMPGAIAALSALRARGVTAIFNSNRDDEHAAATAATLVAAGLGPAVPGETLFMRGDVDGLPGKDGRRTHIARRWCVVAMAGDQLGDFSDGFNASGLAVPERRRLAGSGPLAELWGKGWFMLSNPVYGPGLRGGLEDVYAPDGRWEGTE